MQVIYFAQCSGYKGYISSVCATSDGKIVSGSFDNNVKCGMFRYWLVLIYCATLYFTGQRQLFLTVN